jgi:hypothetical protein
MPPGGKVVAQTKILGPPRHDSGTQLTPDGQQIVYQLGGGNCQILKNEANGSYPLQLTFFDKGFGGTPAGPPMANGSRSTTITTYTAKST